VNSTTSRRLDLQNFDDFPKPSGRFEPSVTLERLARLEGVMLDEIKELGKLVNGK
jgi:hypothetical protein